MRKVGIIISVFLMALIIMGCQNREQLNTETTTADFTFYLPDEYSISDISDTGCSIYQGTEAVGGIVLTRLNNGSIVDIDKTELRQFLDTFAPVPLIYEYVAMYSSNDDYDYVSINFTVTDTETMESNNYHHYLFERNSGCYDLWLIDELVNEEEQKALLIAVVDG